jgi:asparagine synthase (glutamine-hydrolysing)
MCGIVGQINIERTVSLDHFQRMLGSLKHRGPDGQHSEFLEQGLVALGHTRLAIIDLSPAGRQPMTNEDGTIWLTFNGEIYNFRTLREQLISKGHSFSSHTDSEVILHAYEEWGSDCLKKLEGMFAFGIWDSTKKLLFLARDHVGIKPLYYSDDGNTFCFASQPRAIIEREGFKRDVNLAAMDSYVSYGYVPNDECIFKGIKKLPPAHFLILKNGKTEITRYWQLGYEPEIDDFEEAVNAVRNRLEDSVSSQMVSDVPVGVFLSGGIDSSSITSIAQNNYDQIINTFTIGFNETKKDERAYAQIVADSLNTKHHVGVLDQAEAMRILSIYPDIYDEPFYDNSFIPTYFVSELAKTSHNKVILAGDGGDELFAGYKRYDFLEANFGAATPKFKRYLNQLHGKIGTLDQNVLKAYFTKVGCLPQSKRSALLRHKTQSDTEYLRQLYHSGYPTVTAAQSIDFHSYLVEDILAKVDRASMACGIEARVPLLDRKFIELAFKINNNLHYRNGEKKAVLKAALKPLLPREILSTRKKGFSAPLSTWLGASYQNRLTNLVCNGSLVERGIFSQKAAAKIMNGKKHAHKWLLTSAELWSRKWLDTRDTSDLTDLLK